LHKLPRIPTWLRRPAVSILAALLMIGVIGSGLALAGAPTGAPERMATLVRSVLASSDTAPAATANGLAITRQRLNLEVAVRSAQGVDATRAQILDDLINEFVVLSDATRRGITVSDAELAAFIEQQRAIADADPQHEVYRYASALGVAQNDVWSYPFFVSNWRAALTYGAVKHTVLGDVTQKTLNAKEAEWNTYVAGLRAQADIRRFQ